MNTCWCHAYYDKHLWSWFRHIIKYWREDEKSNNYKIWSRGYKQKERLHLKVYQMVLTLWLLHVTPYQRMKGRIFFISLKIVMFPHEYASNISRCANASDGKISILKSYDRHIILQRLLPVATWKNILKGVFQVLDELGKFFKWSCCKTLKRKNVEHLQDDIIFICVSLRKSFHQIFFYFFFWCDWAFGYSLAT